MNDIPWWCTTFGELEIGKIAHAIHHKHISQGRMTAEFESRLGTILGVPHVVATTSGSVALLLSLLVKGIGRGDEVLLPNRAWIAAAHAVLMAGATVRLVDDCEKALIMDGEDVRRKITSKTKAIIAVHLNGRGVDLDRLRKVASENGIWLIEDAAQAFISRNRVGYLGCQSDMGCFSLSMAKIISTGQGGFVVTHDPETYAKLVALRAHGISDVINPEYTRVGFNFRYNDLLASFGLAQLDRLHDRAAHILKIYERYQAGLTGLSRVQLMPVNTNVGEMPLYVEVACDQRTDLIEFLARRQIQCRPFYPPLHQAAYLGCDDTLPNSTRSAATSLFLPCGPDQPPGNIDRVIEEVHSFERSV